MHTPLILMVPGRYAALLLVGLITSLANAQLAADPSFQQPYARQYRAVQQLSADMVVEELRQRVEVIAARGSAVGAASNDRRVRNFESTWLSAMQASSCPRGADAAHPAEPLAKLVEHVDSAAAGQRLRMQGADLAETSALAQRIYDLVGPARWCALKSLDEVR